MLVRENETQELINELNILLQKLLPSEYIPIKGFDVRAINANIGRLRDAYNILVPYVWCENDLERTVRFIRANIVEL